MATYVIYADSTDGYVYGSSGTYATARSGAGTNGVDTTDVVVDVGQFKSTTTYYIYEGFLSFDTSSVVGTPTSATLSVYPFDDGTGSADFTVNARAYDWGATLTTADFVAGASLSGNPLRATLATSGITFNAYNDFTSDSSFVSNLSNPVRLVLSSDRTEAGTSNATNGFTDYIGFRSANQTGTANDPKLTITATQEATGVVLTDAFTGSDATNLSAHALSDSSLWTQVSASGGTSMRLQIASNAAQARSSSGYANARYRCGKTFTDGFAEASFTRVGYFPSTFGGYGELNLRLTDNSNFYQAILDNGDNVGGGRVQLYKVVAGSGTLLGSYDSGSAWPSTSTMRFEVQGTSLRVFVNGVLRITATDSTFTSGYAALALNSQDGTSTSVGTTADDFAAYSAVYGAGGEIAFVSESATAAPAVSAVSASDTATATEGTATVVTGSGVSATDAFTVADSAGVLLQITSSGYSASGLSGWTTRRAMRVDGNASAQTNYHVPVDVTWVSGMKTDFGDVRFTAADGTTLLTYWKDAALLSTGVSARFYVTIPSLPASGGSVNIYMHYGNAGASYAGTARGANGVFLSYDGASNSAIPRASSTGALVRGSSGAWDDRYIFMASVVKNLDGTVYVDGSGYIWGVYNGANLARDATIDLTSPFDGNNAPGDDCPGFFKFLASNPASITKVSSSAPFLLWGSGTWDPSSGTTWDGRVVQQGRIFYDATGASGFPAGTFICQYDGDAGPANVKEAYRQGVATATSLTGTWTKHSTGNPSGQAWTFQHSGLNVGTADDMIAYSGGIICDPDEPDSNKRWKQWYTGHTGAKWGIMHATAPSIIGPWTRYSTSYVWQPRPSDGPYDALVGQAWKLRGIYYLTYEVFGRDTDTDGRKKWAFYVARSEDGINWTLDGAYFNRSTTSGDWDYGRMQDNEVFYNPTTGKWNLAYTASADGNGAAGDDPAYVPDLKIAITEWTATPAFLSSEPTVTFLSGGETVGVSDSAAVTVGVGAVTKTASDGFNVTDTSGGLAVTYWLSSGETVVVADGASSPNTTTVGLTASDVFYVSDASGTGVPSINRRPYWWLHRKRVSS